MRSESTYLDWIEDGFRSFAVGLYYMGKGMIEELGEEKGKALFVRQVNEMGALWGQARKEAFERNGLVNSVENYFNEGMSERSVTPLLWKGGVRDVSEKGGVFEWSYCPIAETFKSFGKLGVEIGELLCQHVDNAYIQAYNPDYEIIQQSSHNRDGVCRLLVKKKDD